jgi:hypothetical protein
MRDQVFRLLRHSIHAPPLAGPVPAAKGVAYQFFTIVENVRTSLS